MLTLFLLTAAAAIAKTSPHPGPQKWGDWEGGQPLPPVSSEALQALISEDDLYSGSAQLQAFADANGGNRVFGSPGHNATVNFLYDVLSSTGYYDVTLQPFVALFSGGPAELTVDGEEIDADIMTYTASGEGTGELVLVNELGCEEADYPSEVEGNIALISRGTCNFAVKAALAFSAGAVGTVIYNNEPGALTGTLGGAGDYAPTVGISDTDGAALVALAEAGAIEATILVEVIEENRTTYNVLAETKGGDHSNVIMAGGHSDSVEKGPGINDDGSGIIGILDVAIALTNFSVTNAVRFGFWSAEEFGLLGSEYYLSVVNQSATDLASIRAYLNFDMIASPNYIYAIYDGDGSSFNLSGPPGSADIESVFEEFFVSKGQNFTSTAFDGRSDYGPFLDNGIPAGGLFTGAEDIKTEEEVLFFGGEAGVAYDVNYHQEGDDINNINLEAFLINTQAIADSIALYATSLDSIPLPEPGKVRRDASASARHAKRAASHSHSHGGCGKDKPSI